MRADLTLRRPLSAACPSMPAPTGEGRVLLRLFTAGCLAMVLAAASCGRGRKSATDASASASKPPVDRLLPSELGRSAILVYGFPIPQGMTVRRRFANSIYLTGMVSGSELVGFVRAHAVTGPVRLAGTRKIFDKVTIRGGDPKRIYTIEVSDLGVERQLVVSDVTPAALEPGLSDEERWKRAGYLPDGTPIASAQSM
jgi:hypothetical protein